MRAAAETLLARYPRFRSIEGSAEATTLRNRKRRPRRRGAGIPLVRPRKGARGVPCGSFAATPASPCSGTTGRTSGSRFSERYENLLRDYGTDYAAVDHKNLDGGAFDAFFGPGAWTLTTLFNEQRLDLEGLRGRLLSSSYTPAPGQPRHDEMRKELDEIFAATNEGGFVRMEYDTRIYLGRLKP